MKYEIGDKVKLRKSSSYYHQAPDQIGEIIEVTKEQSGDAEDSNYCFKIRFPSTLNNFRPKDIELAEPASLVGRYIKALIDRPNGGIVEKGEIGQIIRHQAVDFPNHKNYCITFPLMTSLYELLPVDYVPTPSYVAKPFPSYGKYIKLIVKHDIIRGNKKDVSVCGTMPDVIPKGTITWCNSSYDSRIKKNDTIAIENNKYCANIYASCFEIHPDSKHLFKESKFELPERWAVKCSEISEDTPELLKWRTNKGVENYWFDIGYIDNSRTWIHCPSDKEIEITYDQFITHVYHPWKESYKSIDKLDDDTEIPPIVVHCTTEKEFEHVVKHHNLSKDMSFTTYLGETGVSINGTYDFGGWTSIKNWKDYDSNSTILTYSEWVSKYMPVLDNPILEPIKPCLKFKVGDRVVAIAESHGWGGVKKGDIGVVKSLDSDGGYYVDFLYQKSWHGKESCFQLAETVDETSTTSENITFSLTNTQLVTKITNPIKDVENVNVLITKKSKIRVLSI
jgi:hypothetical protein